MSLAGTGLAARPLITGRDVKDRTLRSRDVADGSLGKRDFARALRGPRGHRGPAGPAGPHGGPGPPGPEIPLTVAVVAADGASGAVAVAHPATGVYCVRGDRPQWARVTSADPAAGQAVAARAYTGSTPADPPCDADTAVRVTVAGTSGLANGPFHLLMRP